MSLGVSIGIDVTIRDRGARTQLATFVAGLRSKQGLHEVVAKRALELTRNYLTRIALSRHDTAQRLGATPSGHWAQAAEKTGSTADESQATIRISHPGIGRAAHDVTIKPGAGKQFLTIPLIAEAYNQRAYRVPGLHMIIDARGTHGLLIGEDDRAWYLLVRQVTQKQDRTLLPSDAEYRQAALEGVRDYVGYLLGLSTRGGAS